MSIESYQKIQQIYHKEVADILSSPHVVIEEKVDGSQFRIQLEPDGTIKCGSHHQELSMVDSMFKLATDQAETIFAGVKTEESVTVFCEYLKSIKQNALVYARVPKNNLVIFDVKVGNKYLNRAQKEVFASIHGMEIVPCLYQGAGNIITPEVIQDFLKRESFLGKAIIEGIVIKAYDQFYDVNEYPYLQGHWKCAKIVRPEFKEINADNQSNEKQGLEKLIQMFNTEARFEKALQHCKELGQTNGAMQDLKYLVPEVQNDLEQEEIQTIKDKLYETFGKAIIRGSVRGLPEWYKKKLYGETTQ